MNRIEFSRLPIMDYATDEAINTLCTNLTFSGADVKTIMITSTKVGEGKTFISLHVAKKLSELGKRVVLVDADLRRSILAEKYGITLEAGKDKGLSHYLAGLSEINDVVYKTSMPNMLLVPIGREVSNSLALLNSERFSCILKTLSDQANYIIVDSPPIGVIIDAAEIAKSCDGVLVVVRYNQIKRRELLDVKEQIERTGSKFLGAVLNGVTFDTISSKRYYYRSYYSQYGQDYYSSSSKPMRQVASRKRGKT